MQRCTIQNIDGIDFDRRGQPLADGRCCIFWALAMDLDVAKDINLADYKKSEPCTLYKCNSSIIPWTDNRQFIAAWLTKLCSQMQYAAAHPDRPAILKMWGASIHYYIPDTLHCKNVGSDATFVGSVIRFLTHHLLPGTPDENLTTVQRQLKFEYGRVSYKGFVSRRCTRTLQC